MAPAQAELDGGLFGLAIDSAQLSALLATADHVIIKGEMEKTGSVVTDRRWIRRMSEEISRLKLEKGDYCLCCGWSTAYFYKRETLLGSIAPIHGDQVRISSEIGYGDFIIPEERWNALKEVFNEKKSANQRPQGTPGRVPSSSTEPGPGAPDPNRWA